MNTEEYIIDLLDDIQKIATLLESQGVDTSSIYTMKSSLESNKPHIKYKLKPMKFYFENNLRYPKVKSHKKVQNLELIFDMEAYIDFDMLISDKDPIILNPQNDKNFSFNIKIFGNEETDLETKLVYTLHFDKHDGSVSPMPHPIYHFQLGGRELKDNITDYGQALFLDSPRIMHHPMEFILGIDFVLSNFFPNIWNNIKREIDYIDVVKKYQIQFIKPYFKSIVNHFEDSSTIWNPQNIYPQLIGR